MKLLPALILFLQLILPFLASADNGADTGPLGWGKAELLRPLETDRPDFTEGTQTVESGHLQIESGYTFTYNKSAEDITRSHAVPELLLRVGVLDDLEFRLGWEGYLNQRVKQEIDGVKTNETTDGVSDLTVAFKHNLYAQNGIFPDFALLLELGVPSGSSDFNSGKVEPALGLLWAYQTGENSSIAGNVNLAVPYEDNGRYLEISASLAAGYDLSESLGAYVEYYGFYPAESSTAESTQHYINSGFTYSATENLQFDIRAGAGLNNAADDFLTGVGFAYRI